MSRSHVSLEQHYCCVCGNAFDTGTVLLHKRLAQVLDHHTVTGFSLCPEHKALHEQGYVALVEIIRGLNMATGDMKVDPDERPSERAMRVSAIINAKRMLIQLIQDKL